MNGGYSVTRILRSAAAGATGGLVSFILMNPSMVAQEEARSEWGGGAQAADAIRNVLLLGLVLGMAIGAALIFVDELQSHNWQRLALYTLSGALIGATCGVIGSVGGQTIFSALLGVSSGGTPGTLTVIVARTFGWTLLGGAAGICPGVVSRSPRRVLQGIFGGAVGGGLGGAAFDILGGIFHGGSISRAVGFVLIGALVGALVSLVEEFAKEYWLVALTGAKEGRTFIVSRDVMTLGRNEMADIPLFGDLSVQRQHARLCKQNGGIVLMAEPGQMVTVNNLPVMGSPLQPGDIVGIGAHRLRFGARRAPANSPLPQPGVEPLHASTSVPIIPDPGGMAPPAAFPTAVTPSLTRLEVIGGPHTGMMFALTSGAILGRDPRCDIPLVQDTQASRQHARLLLGPDGWAIEDGGSTNGLWINGQRVARHLLQPGDQIGIGQSLLRAI
jgi:hypothetical protein